MEILYCFLESGSNIFSLIFKWYVALFILGENTVGAGGEIKTTGMYTYVYEDIH